MGAEKGINPNTKLLVRATTKNIPEMALMLVVVLGSSKLIPNVAINVIERNRKLPALNKILFSLVFMVKNPYATSALRARAIKVRIIFTFMLI